MSDSLPAFTHALTPESAARWLAARDGRLVAPPAPGTVMPLSYLCFLRVQPATGRSVHQVLGRDPDRGLFGGVGYRADRGPRVGDVFEVTSRVRDRKRIESPRGELTVTTLTVAHRAADGATITETVRMVDLPAGPPRTPARGPVEPCELPHATDLIPTGAVQAAWMTVETGDMNPLHLDPAYAAARLFPAVVLPGPLVAALVEDALTRAAGHAPTGFTLRLRAANYPGESLRLMAAPDCARYRVLTTDGELRVEGEADFGRPEART